MKLQLEQNYSLTKKGRHWLLSKSYQKTLKIHLFFIFTYFKLLVI